jgi:biotin-(acetyl-CoA carboxylase) ligase
MIRPYHILRFPSLPSTFTYILDNQNSLNFSENSFAVFAETQTSGLGTNSRIWSSPPGGIYLSFGFRVTNPPKNFHTAIPLFNIFSSLVLRELITEKAGKSGVGVSGQNGGIKFKWPNDVFWGETRKLAGIKSLVESDGSG